jgi:hypothetical protein
VDGRLGSRRVDGDVGFLAVVGLEPGSVLTLSYVECRLWILGATTKVNVHLSSVLFVFGSGEKREKSVDENTKRWPLPCQQSRGPDPYIDFPAHPWTPLAVEPLLRHKLQQAGLCNTWPSNAREKKKKRNKNDE